MGPIEVTPSVPVVAGGLAGPQRNAATPDSLLLRSRESGATRTSTAREKRTWTNRASSAANLNCEGASARRVPARAAPSKPAPLEVGRCSSRASAAEKRWAVRKRSAA